jgi:hypothetical protein
MTTTHLFVPPLALPSQDQGDFLPNRTANTGLRVTIG